MQFFSLKGKGIFQVEQIIDQENGTYAIITPKSVTALKPALLLKGYKVFKLTKKQVNSLTFILPEEFESKYEAANSTSDE